jgi:hypothetical protein
MKAMLGIPGLLAILLLPLVLSAHVLFAQGGVATLTGEIRDASSGAIAKAAVSARSLDTNITRSTVSNDTGCYTIVGLPPGNYEVTVQAPSFRRELRFWQYGLDAQPRVEGR